MHDEIRYLPATELAKQIREKALSPVEVVRAHLDAIEAINPTLNAIVIPAEDALDRAREAEAAVMRHDALGPLHGVPYTLKDCVEVAGMRITQGSKLWADAVSNTDATVHTRLKEAGGILLGKTNMPEFALWWETDNLVFGPTHNPWDLDRTPGGSSGGEAAAIASGLSPLGVGTDAGGSIRQPASFCGIPGLKPTLGRVAYTGIEPQTLLRVLHVGPMGRTIEDIALGLSIMAGPDGLDVYAPPVPVSDYTALDGPLPRVKIGWSPTGGLIVEEEVQAVVTNAATALSDLGLQVEPVEIPGLEDAGRISAAVYKPEGAAYLSKRVAGRVAELSTIVRQRYVDTPEDLQEYLQAQFEWDSLRKEVAQYFTRYDMFLCPTTPMPAYPAGQTEIRIGGRALGTRQSLLATVPWNLTGSPAISVPFGWSSEGLPIGVQLVGRHFDELAILRVAKALEDCHTDRRRPAVA
jgi:aspartyl-tRNA(Asn)/glutamyl-tRNA(Gln) amidotransferase subunit A